MFNMHEKNRGWMEGVLANGLALRQTDPQKHSPPPRANRPNVKYSTDKQQQISITF